MVPQVKDGNIRSVQIMPQERLRNRTVEQVVDVPVPQIQEEIVEVIVAKS